MRRRQPHALTPHLQGITVADAEALEQWNESAPVPAGTPHPDARPPGLSPPPSPAGVSWRSPHAGAEHVLGRTSPDGPTEWRKGK